jgi:hypothetical protein
MPEERGQTKAAATPDRTHRYLQSCDAVARALWAKQRVRSHYLGMLWKPALHDIGRSQFHRSHVEYERSGPDMWSYGIDDLLQASDGRGEHDDRATRCHLKAGERNTVTPGYRLEARGRVICAQPKVRPDVACDELPKGAEAYDADC